MSKFSTVKVSVTLLSIVFLSLSAFLENSITKAQSIDKVQTSQLNPTISVELDALIPKLMKDYGVPGAAIAVVENGQLTLVKGYGVRDISKPDAVDENTIFQLASISKVFTAAAAATLVDQAKMNWDTPIINYLPDFVAYDPYVTRYLTLRDLLAMRTGWPAFTGDLLNDFGYNRQEILTRLRYLKPAYSFREVSQYSNPGIFVAGEAAARVNQSSWNDLVQKNLLEPLEMKRSGTSVEDLQDSNSYRPHAFINGKLQAIDVTDRNTMGAPSAVTSTAADMGNWLQMFLNNGTYKGKQILKAQTVTEMYKRSMVGEITFTELPPINENTGFYYGLGFDSFDYAGYHIIGKAGARPGVRTIMTLLPEKRAGIAVMANLNVTAFPEAVRSYFLDKVLGKPPETNLKEIFERNQKLAKLFVPPSRPANPGKFNGQLQDLVGVYTNPLYGNCGILLESEKLWVECGPAKYRGSLTHWNHGEFVLQWPSVTTLPDPITFTIGADGKANNFIGESIGLFTRVSGK